MGLGCAIASTFRMTLTSLSDVSDDDIVGLGGHLSWLASHVGPFHHRVDSVTIPPRLAKSAPKFQRVTMRFQSA